MGRQGAASSSYTSIGTFGELLKVLRRRAELTQHELGAAVGYSDSYITRLERNERRPDVATVRARFIDALHLSGDPILAGRLIALAAQAESETQPRQALPTPPISRATNLSAPLTQFIGRAHEIAEVERLLCTARLLTLTGSGGVGKTRLAIEAGTHQNEIVAYADGVWLVELAPLADAGPLTQTVAAAFGLQTMSRPALVVLTDYLADRKTLLILDNCEHLIDACAALAESLLQACPNLRILATSREGLNIGGEVIWCVPPLVQDDSVQLFAERAAAVKPGFVVTAANRAPVERICRWLDDMPLAIELAAARVRAFTLEQLALRMDDAFRLLTGGSRTALPRQKTLRATIDWSYNLLPEPERALLRGLSVFAGGWTLEAAEAILGASLQEQYGVLVETQGVASLQASLVNKSLVVVEEDEASGGVRYRMLETIRQYASAVAQHTGTDELAPVRQRHLEYYTHLAQAGQVSPEPGIWHWIWNTEVAAELDNTRVALKWAAQSGTWDRGWQLIRGALGVWTMLGYAQELRQWMHAIVLSNPVASDTACGIIWAAMGRMQYDTGDADGGLECYQIAAQIAHQIGDVELQLETNQYLGFLTPDYEQAAALLTSTTQLAQKTGRKARAAWAMCMLGHRMCIQGNLQQASNTLAVGISLAQEAGDPGIYPASLVYLHRLYLELGDYPRALAAAQESVSVSRQCALQGTMAIALGNLAEMGLHMGNQALARQALHENLPLLYRMDYLGRVAQGLVTAAGLALVQGQAIQAARLLGAAEAIHREHHSLGIFEADVFAEYYRRLLVVRGQLGPDTFESAWAEGQNLGLNQAVQTALAV